MSKKAIIFGIEDVLYDASLQTSNARLSAVKAMIEAGLPVDVESCYRTLETVVSELGPDNTKHFDKLLERLGLPWSPNIIAAGVVAYRAAEPVYLKPYPETLPTLLKLRDLGVRLGCASGGKSVKQWQKLIGLGLQHIFHKVVIAQDLEVEEFNKDVLKRALNALEAPLEETLYVGARLDSGINVANELGLFSVLLTQGNPKTAIAAEPQARYRVNKFSEILKLVE
jgi:putative hydrolase of the HAD superfamily